MPQIPDLTAEMLLSSSCLTPFLPLWCFCNKNPQCCCRNQSDRRVFLSQRLSLFQEKEKQTTSDESPELVWMSVAQTAAD